ncbi:MAG: SRPBCC family protein [Massilia sp.]
MDQQRMTDTGLDLGKLLAGAAAGAVLMYMLDPDRGRARRSQTSEKIMGMGRQTGATLSNALERVGSRFSGAAGSTAGEAMDTASRVASSVKPNGAADRPMSETVSRIASDAGSALSGSMNQVTEAASNVAGRVRQAVQGMRGRSGKRGMAGATDMQGGWAPAMRSSAMFGGGMLGLYGLMRRSPIGMALGLAGIALLARGITNQPLRSMMRGQGLGQTIDLEKTIHIDAAPEEVYDLWTNYENFPRFMSHVVEVRDLGKRRSHWVVKGPAGSEFEWNSVLTEQSRPSRLAWRTEPGAEIGQTGSVQFEPYRGGTLVTVRMSYSPPAGALGHGLATLLGADPKRQMDDDLSRMKAFVERGAIPRDMAQRGGATSRFLH